MNAKRQLYDPGSTEPFKLSRTKLDLFMQCPRCFYLDRRLGVGRPKGPPFTLNSAVDHLLKIEFDLYRARGAPHPLMQRCGIEAVPFAHPKLDQWRHNFTGIRHHHRQTNFLVFGAIDDVWVTPGRQLLIVDYKSTSKEGEITLDDPWKETFKRQMEIYQWLFRQNGFQVAATGYFVYANALKTEPAFGDRLRFKTVILPYEGSDAWVPGALGQARACLQQGAPPESPPGCDYCTYRRAAGEAEGAGP